jgi:hypothetical protein
VAYFKNPDIRVEEREFEGYLSFLSFHAEYTFDP